MMKGLVVFLLLTVFLSYALYKPLPPSVEQKWIVGSYIFVIDSIIKFVSLSVLYARVQHVTV